MWPAKQGIDLDVDNLYVKQALANDGPRMKRIRPAPMGRAYRYQRRLTHIVLSVAEREARDGPGDQGGRAGDGASRRPRQEGAPRRRRPAAKKAPQRRRPQRRPRPRRPAAPAKKAGKKAGKIGSRKEEVWDRKSILTDSGWE